jgi:prolyl oligopeptidase
MQYPKTKKDNIRENIFGVEVSDNYRWLEDDNSEETRQWVLKQQELTNTLLSEYPDREKILADLTSLANNPMETIPLKRGEWYYFAKNSGLQNQWVSYRTKKIDGEAELFFDPNSLSEDGTTRAYVIGRSKDNKYFAYAFSKSGSDLFDLCIMDTEKKEFISDKMTNMIHTGASWYKDGFFYSKYDKVKNRGQYENQRVYYHKLFDNIQNDELIFEEADYPLRYHDSTVSDDGKYIIINSSQGTSGNILMFKEIEKKDASFSPICDNFDFNNRLLDSYQEDVFYLYTNREAKNYKLLRINLKNLDQEELIIPEREYPLSSVNIVGEKIIAIFSKDVKSMIVVFDLDGNYLYDIPTPYQCRASVIFVKKEVTACFLSLSSYEKPTEFYHYNIAENKLTFYKSMFTLKLDTKLYKSKQIFFESKDATKIPMTLIYKKDMQQNGINPLHLYGYGGFEHSLLPFFNPSIIPFLEKNGIHAIVNLRGGGEYGESWHQAGMKLNKQNVFDDFISAAEYLIAEKYTNPDKIAISGGSNGGLLIGACMLQRPDLFKVALPWMGVLDMLRFHKFTCGWGWIVEYGNPDEEKYFHNLLKYSPLHNVKEGVKYPATMVVTAEHDDRVIPGHSFKFAATLQEKGDQSSPYLLYTMLNSSHGASSLQKQLEVNSDCYSFMFKYLDI